MLDYFFYKKKFVYPLNYCVDLLSRRLLYEHTLALASKVVLRKKLNIARYEHGCVFLLVTNRQFQWLEVVCRVCVYLHEIIVLR